MTPRHPAPRLPAVDIDRCTGCGRCVAACAPRVLSLEPAPGWRKSAVLHEAGGCTGCSVCAARCPFEAIAMRRPEDGASS
ncbi:MAG: ATP-binding protein [Burkholderiaceae bacterium]